MLYKRPIKVNEKYISFLLNKYNKGLEFTKDEKDNFFYKENEKFILCFNEDASCNIEKFKHYFSMLLYCWTDIPDFILLRWDYYEIYWREPCSDTADTDFKGIKKKKPR